MSSGRPPFKKETKKTSSSLTASFRIDFNSGYGNSREPLLYHPSYDGQFGVHQYKNLIMLYDVKEKKSHVILSSEKPVCALSFAPKSNDRVICVTEDKAQICQIKAYGGIRKTYDPVQTIDLPTSLHVTPTSSLRCRILDNDRMIIFISDCEYDERSRQDQTQGLCLDLKEASAQPVKIPEFEFTDVEAISQNELIFCTGGSIRRVELPTPLTKECKELDIRFSHPEKFQHACSVNIFPESNLAIFTSRNSILIAAYENGQFELLREINLNSDDFLIKPVIISGQFIFCHNNEVIALNILNGQMDIISKRSALALFEVNQQIGVQYGSEIELHQTPFQLVQQQVLEKLSVDTSGIVMSYLHANKDAKSVASIIREDEKAKKEHIINEIKNLRDLFKQLREQKTTHEKIRHKLFSTKPQENEKIYQALCSLLELANKHVDDFAYCVNQVKRDHPVLTDILNATIEQKTQPEEYNNYNRLKDILKTMETSKSPQIRRS